jgi:hypothetical protein
MDANGTAKVRCRFVRVVGRRSGTRIQVINRPGRRFHAIIDIPSAVRLAAATVR